MGLGYHYRNILEYILLHSNGKSERQITDQPNYCQITKPSRTEAMHPTAKPVNLYRWLIKNSSRDGEIILDPFAGSGTIGLASIAEKRRWIGVEADKEFIKHARKRISAVQNQGELF